MLEKIYQNYNLNKNNGFQLNKNIKLGFIICLKTYKIFFDLRQRQFKSLIFV